MRQKYDGHREAYKGKRGNGNNGSQVDRENSCENFSSGREKNRLFSDIEL